MGGYATISATVGVAHTPVVRCAGVDKQCDGGHRVGEVLVWVYDAAEDQPRHDFEQVGDQDAQHDDEVEPKQRADLQGEKQRL